jgi:hypothetical protein
MLLGSRQWVSKPVLTQRLAVSRRHELPKIALNSLVNHEGLVPNQKLNVSRPFRGLVPHADAFW